MIEHFGYVAAVNDPFGGICIYRHIYNIYDIYTYDIRYPSLGGFFLGGEICSIITYMRGGTKI